MVRLGQMGGFQDRSNSPLWHLSTLEFVLSACARCAGMAVGARPRSAGVVYRIGLGLDAVVW